MKTVTTFFVALFAVAIAAPSFREELEIDLPSNDEQSDDKIVGGNTTTIEDYPYQISLRLDGQHNCGGSVLTKIRGLTAAHCLNRFIPISRFTIKAGSTFRLDQGDPNAQIRTLSRFILHPQYHPPTIRNNIALMQWTEPLKFGITVRPIALPGNNVPVPDGTKGLTTGWGRTREGVFGSMSELLRIVATPVVNNTVCNRSYNGRVTVDMICAGFPDGGRGPCQGDNGGPMVIKSSKRFVQIGIVSWSTGCARPNKPTVYTRVTHFATWIQTNL